TIRVIEEETTSEKDVTIVSAESKNGEAEEKQALTFAEMIEAELAKGNDLSIIALVQSLIERGEHARASDIHLDPEADGLKVRMRVDGVLQNAHVFPLAIHQEVVSRIKILSGLRTDEHQSAQDGRFCARIGNGRSIDIRVSVIPTFWGENAVMRLLSDKAEEFTLKSLGFTPENEQKILRAISKPHGMILATGPTGSGKTTTLYTLIRMLNTEESSIITIEDPIEYSIPGINQIQVKERTGLTFANGLRSMLRQDPNIIMVGEIRDVETAALAVNIALAGHLILSTLHTSDAATTLPRLLDMKVEPYLVASTVNLVIGQRLVRKICVECKKKKNMTDAEIKSLSGIISREFLGEQKIFYHGIGCDECGGTGYMGRMGIHEVMDIDHVIRDAILRKESANNIRLLAEKQGMIPIILDGFHKAAQGLTTIEEILRMRYE
ncbi:MAG: GspE/PulE family protein, partial [Patescibacteria group bacterium]